MITLQHVHYEIHDEMSKNDKVHNSFIKKIEIVKWSYKMLKKQNEVQGSGKEGFSGKINRDKLKYSEQQKYTIL